MPILPIITFKAGQCEIGDGSSRPLKVKPQPQPGYIYLYSEDDLIHFCWRRRDQPLDEPELDLVMVPTDGSFVAYGRRGESTSKTNGRIYVLKFASSSQRYLFWMQSKSQARDGNPAWFSPRDVKIGDIVHRLLQGEEVNVAGELANVRNTGDQDDDDDDDESMEDVEGTRGPHTHRGRGSGGAGPDATGGDVREEGEESREGGADGARAASSSAPDAAAAVRNFLNSFQGQQGISRGQRLQSDLPYPHLNHLLPPSVTGPMLDAASLGYIDILAQHLPSAITQPTGPLDSSLQPARNGENTIPADDRRNMMKRVLRSPQFSQALHTLTMALRDGGLPGIAQALSITPENGGYLQGSGMPLGGDQAVRAFIEGVRRSITGSDKSSRETLSDSSDS